MTTRTRRGRTERIEVRATPDERALIDEAVAVTGGDLTSFVMSNLTLAARRVLADRTEFVLDDAGRAQWEAINARPARDIPGLQVLLRRPSPFGDA